jgi:hypothetical protein
MILGIDPGTTHSGVVLWNGSNVVFVEAAFENGALLDKLRAGWRADARIACEWIQAMGMPVGQEVFQTCRFIGRIEEIVEARGQKVEYLTRPTVKTRLCGSPRAKDPNVRQALIDRVGPVGTKANPGPCYGVSSHAWSALAVAIAINLQ